jgi:hypothetical protein
LQSKEAFHHHRHYYHHHHCHHHHITVFGKGLMSRNVVEEALVFADESEYKGQVVITTPTHTRAHM